MDVDPEHQLTTLEHKEVVNFFNELRDDPGRRGGGVAVIGTAGIGAFTYVP
jgi:hypothetical protein